MYRCVLQRACHSSQRLFVSSRSLTTDLTRPPSQIDKVQPVPKPHELEPTDDKVQIDQVTHTGQPVPVVFFAVCKAKKQISEKLNEQEAWDQSDYRLARFTYRDKQINPNVAARLVSEVKPIEIDARIVACDGGGGALGHPKVYINLDKPGNHICGYCGLRFTKLNQPNPGIDNPSV